MEILITITQTKVSLVKVAFKIPNDQISLYNVCVSLHGPFHGQ